MISKKGRIDKMTIQLEFLACNNDKYKVEEIRDNAIYAKKLENHLLRLYYLVL